MTTNNTSGGNSTPEVTTDLPDYAPGSTATVTASNFEVGSTIEFQALHVLDAGADGVYGTADDTLDVGANATGQGHEPWIVTDGVLTTLPGADGIVGTADDVRIGDLDGVANGEIATTWYVNPDDSLGATFALTATAINAGEDGIVGSPDDVPTGQAAATSFTDSAPNPAPLQTYFVPMPEQAVNFIFNDLEGSPSDGTISDGIVSITSLTISRSGTLVYYDQWENGYDADIANPTNIYSASNLGGTQIWGNNNPADGMAPGFTTDTFNAGDVVILRNVVPTNPRNTSQILFDGGDKIGTTAAVAVTRGYWPQTVEGSGGSVLGGATEVVDTFRYGTEFKVPVGENLPSTSGTGFDNDMFSYSALVIQAAQDGTTVQVDVNGDGDFADATDVNTTLNQGQSYVVRGTGDGSGPSLPSGPGINANSRVLSDKPVQVSLITGKINANAESDSFTLTPLSQLGNSYFSPVTTTGPSSATSGAVSYFLYNPAATGTLKVNWEAAGGVTGSINVAHGATERFTPTVAGSGIHFYTSTPSGSAANPDGASFDVVATVDSATSTYAGQNYDWGFSPISQGSLTSQVVVGWAQGSSDTNGNVVSGANGSPLWVTATANTTVYVDWNGNPADSTLTAPNGQKYDIAYTVNALQSVRLYDSKFNDSDQSGARLFTTDGSLIAVAYGEDPTKQGSVPGFIGNNAFGSTEASPYLDVGATVLPLPALAIKKFTDGQDADSAPGPSILVGSVATFTYLVSNNGGAAVKNVAVVDDGGPDPSFTPTAILGTGSHNIGDTNNNNQLDPGEVWQYTATRTVTPGLYTNIATVTATDKNNQAVAPDADPSNHFGAVGSVSIEKQVSLDGISWQDADSPTGPSILAGSSVFYRVAVTNSSTGGVPATVDLTDATITGSGPVLDFTFGGGNTQTTTVAAGATVFSNVISGTALSGQNTDRASASATVSDNFSNTKQVVVTPDDANYFGAAGSVSIKKQVSIDGGATWQDADSPTGPVILAGATVSYRVAVTNSSTGGVPATVDLTDATITGSGPVLDFTFGGGNAQTTTVAAGATVFSNVISGTALSGQNTDRASAIATVSDGVHSASVTVAPNDANYFGATGSVAIEKQVSLDGISWQNADSPTGPSILAGSSVFYRVAVTNSSTGGVAATVDLTDATITGSGPVLDFTFGGGNTQTTSVAAGATVFSNVISGTALSGQNTDRASAIASVSDGVHSASVTVAPDDANYFGATGSVTIEKQVSLDGVSWQDADSPTGPSILAGSSVFYRVAVTNNSTGGVAATVDLTDATITGSGPVLDFTFGGGNTQTTSVAAGATVFSNVISGTALSGQNTDRASAIASVSDGVHSASVTVGPDDANYFGATGSVTIEKQVSLDGVSWQDADSPTGPSILAGSSVFYRVAVTNNSTGGVAATVDLTDATITGSGPVLDFTFGGGNTQTTTVAAGATVFSNVISGTALSGQNTDRASAIASVSDGVHSASVTVAPDDANYFGAIGSVTIEKQVSLDGVSWQNADSPTGPSILAGSSVFYRVAVTNSSTGGVAATVDLTDATITGSGPVLDFTFGGGNTQTTAVAAGATVFSNVISGTALSGQNTDRASAIASVSDGVHSASVTVAPDDANYFGATGSISIEKQVSIDGGATWQDADSPTGPSILASSTVMFRVAVTNNSTGGVAATVDLNDAILSGGGSAHDFTFGGGNAQTTTVAAGATVFSNVISEAAFTGQNTDEASAVASVTDGVNSASVSVAPDDANYFGATGSISIEKQVSIDGGATWQDADSPTGPSILAGSTVMFRVAVTNNSTGGVAATVDLNDAILSGGGSAHDFTFGGGNAQTTTVAAGATVFSNVISEAAFTGQNTDEASAIASVTDGVNSTSVSVAPDDANYFGATGSVSIEKQVSIDGGATWQDADSPTGPSILAGSTVMFRVAVTNNSTGGVAATVDLNDAILSGGGSAHDFTFGGGNSQTTTVAAGATVFSNVISEAAFTGQNTDEASAIASVTDGVNSASVSVAPDDANYFGATGSISIEKQVSIDGGATWQDADSPTGPSILAGSTVMFRVAVTNNSTGGVAATVDLNDAILSGGGSAHDFTFGGGNAQTTTVAAGATVFSNVISEAAFTGQNTDEASAVASVTDGVNSASVSVAPDDANYFGATGSISIEKQVSIDGGATWQDADSPTGPSILAGSTVMFRVAVTNNSTGGVAATVDLNDTILSGGGSAHDFTFGGGNAQTTTVAAGATVFSNVISEAAFTGQNTDEASAIASVTDGVNSTSVSVAPDDANYFGATGSVSIEKQVSIDGGATWQDADSPTGPSILAGSTVMFRVAVTNNSTGGVAATVDLNDAILSGGGSAHDFTFGGGNSQTTTVAAGATVFSNVISEAAFTGQNTDEASATASVTDGVNSASVSVAPDDANYFGATGSVSIEKQVSIDGGATWQDADSPTGPSILAGSTVMFRVAVTNNSTGGVAATVDLNDAILSGGGSAHDFTFGGGNSQTTTVAAGATVFSNVISEAAFTGQNTDEASAIASVTDGVNSTSVSVAPDDANYFGATGSVSIEKQVSIDGGATWQDADSPTGPSILAGSTVMFRVAVTNNSTGGVAATVDLTDATITGSGPVLDFTFGGGNTQTTTVAAGATVFSNVISGTALSGQNTDRASAIASVSDGVHSSAVTVAPDDANYFGATGSVSIEKQVSVDGGATWQDADSPTGPSILAGSTVMFRVAVTNNSTGGVAATVDLTDTTITGSGPVLDFTFGGGNTQTTTVAAGTTVFSNVISGTALSGQNTDRASAIASVSDGVHSSSVTVAPDDANYFGATGSVSIEKQVSIDGGATWQDADSPTGPSILAGSTVMFRVAVTNNSTGGVAATVDLTDATITGSGPVLDFTFGGGNTQTTTVAAGATVFSNVISGTALSGQNTDRASAIASVSDGVHSSSVSVAPDDANYFGATGSVSIEKQVSIDGGATWQDADSPTGPSILAGSTVMFRVAVTNNSTGGVAATVDLTDTTITGSGPVLDFTFGGGNTQTTTVAAGATVFSNVISGTALSGQNTDRASAIASVSDGVHSSSVTVAPDDANYFGMTGSVSIEKQVSVDGGATWQDADSPTGPSILAGSTVMFRVAVTNNSTGGVAATVDLTDATITGSGPVLDFTFGGGNTQTTTVAAGATVFSNVISGTALSGQNTDRASAIASVSDGVHSSSVTVAPDDANYFGATGSVTIEKQVSLNGTTWQDADSPTGPSILAGSSVFYRVAVTNNSTGSVAATVDLTDATITGSGPVLDFTFGGGNTQTTTVAAGATVFSNVISGTALTGQNTDRASAIASVSDGVHSSSVTVAPDDANYFGATGSVSIEKQVSVDGGATWQDADSPTGPTVSTGATVAFRVAVTNNSTGGVAATVDLTDATITGSGPVLDFTFGGGNTQTTTVAAGATVFSNVITTPALTGQQTDRASAIASVTDGVHSATVSVTPDDANYIGIAPAPSLTITKTAQIIGDADQKVDSASDDITYTITVKNTGNVPLTGVVVKDQIAGQTQITLDTNHSTPTTSDDAVLSGDTNSNGILDTTETWTYTYVLDVTQADINNFGNFNWKDGGTAASPTSANGTLIFSGSDFPATGSGLTNSFVRIMANGTEQGYNTDHRPQQFNEDNTATFDHSIKVADIPVVTIGGTQYWEFRLDTNEANGGTKPLLSLDSLKLFSAATGDLTGLNNTTNTFSSGPSTLLYNLDSAGDKTVQLTDWNTGSGHGDYAFDIPVTAGLSPQTFIYLYSAFGATNATDGGFEEWYVRTPGSISNTATVSTVQTSAQSASAVVGVSTAAGQLGITKTATVVDGVANTAGDVINYAITVQNLDGVTLTGIVVTDQIEGQSQITLDTNHSTTTTSDDAVLSGDLNNNGMLDVGESWIYTLSHILTQSEIDTKGVNGDGKLTNTAAADSDQTHPASATASVNIVTGGGGAAPETAADNSIAATAMASPASWWAANLDAWDGSLSTNSWSGLGHALIDVDSNNSGSITPADQKGILLGDVNANGLTDAGETTLFVPLAAAQQLINASDTSTDLRQIMMREAIAAQLNINSMSGDSSSSTTSIGGPDNITAEAAMWLRGIGPYTYSDGTGNVDSNGDGSLSVGSNNSEYNANTQAFTGDANFLVANTQPLSSTLNAWLLGVDVDSTANNIQASGQDLKNGLQQFNTDHLITSGADIGWNNGTSVTNIQPNTSDAFWGVLQANTIMP